MRHSQDDDVLCRKDPSMRSSVSWCLQLPNNSSSYVGPELVIQNRSVLCRREQEGTRTVVPIVLPSDRHRKV
jgi:hypothetical protein